MDPECQLGMILKAYFKKETLVSEVFSSYMRENYFTRWVSGIVMTVELSL